MSSVNHVKSQLWKYQLCYDSDSQAQLCQFQLCKYQLCARRFINSATYIKWLWSWARARSGSCSHYFSWRYLAVIDTRFLACAHYQGEASRPLLPPLENVLTSHTDSFHEIYVCMNNKPKIKASKTKHSRISQNFPIGIAWFSCI